MLKSLAYGGHERLDSRVTEIAEASFREKETPAILVRGYFSEALEASLWAVDCTDRFREATVLCWLSTWATTPTWRGYLLPARRSLLRRGGHPRRVAGAQSPPSGSFCGFTPTCCYRWRRGFMSRPRGQELPVTTQTSRSQSLIQ
jgi:hypothetical protein